MAGDRIQYLSPCSESEPDVEFVGRIYEITNSVYWGFFEVYNNGIGGGGEYILYYIRMYSVDAVEAET